jgi:hypothetical protein
MLQQRGAASCTFRKHPGSAHRPEDRVAGLRRFASGRGAELNREAVSAPIKSVGKSIEMNIEGGMGCQGRFVIEEHDFLSHRPG